MLEREKNDLQELEFLDRFLVVIYWRWLRWRQRLRHVPIPLRLAAIEAFVTGAFLTVAVVAVR